MTAMAARARTIPHVIHEIWSFAGQAGEAYLRPMDKTSSGSTFWHDSLLAMHPSLRVRYYQWFPMADAMDRNFDSVLDLWKNANAAAMQNLRAILR